MLASLVNTALFSFSSCARPPPAPAPVAGGPDNDADLYGRTVFQVLLAEIALQRGQIDMGVGAYADLARRTWDAKVVARATEVALIARQAELALDLEREGYDKYLRAA